MNSIHDSALFEQLSAGTMILGLHAWMSSKDLLAALLFPGTEISSHQWCLIEGSEPEQCLVRITDLLKA